MTAQKNHLKGKIFVITSITLFATCFSGIALFKPQILTAILQHEHPTWTMDQVESKASFYKGLLDGASAIVTLFALPMLGSLSDIYGRKIIMIVGSCALSVIMVLYKLSYTYNSLWMLYLSVIFSFYMCTQISCIAYMTDVSTDEKDKAKNFGIVLAAFMGGMIIGSMGLGEIGSKFGISVSLYVLFAMSIATAGLQLVFQEDTDFYEKRKERKFDIRKSNPFVAMKLVLGTSGFVTVMTIVYALNFLAISDSNTSYLYTENRYNWGSFENGLTGAVSGVSSILWQGLGVAILLKYVSRVGVLTITFFVATAVHSVQGFSPWGWLFMSGVVVSGFVTIGFPLMQSLISEQIPTEQQGMAFGGLSSITSISSLVGELITESVLSYCLVNKHVPTCPGTAFYICGFIFFLDAIVCVYIYFKYPQIDHHDEIKKDGYVSINAAEEDRIV